MFSLAIPGSGTLCSKIRIGRDVEFAHYGQDRYVRRQNAIEGIVGEEMAAGFIGQRPIDVALKQAEKRTNTLLGELN